MWSNLQFPADLVTLTREILNGNLHFFVQWRIHTFISLGSFAFTSIHVFKLIVFNVIYYFASYLNPCFLSYFYRNVWGLWRRRKLYMDLWWRGSQLHWICTAAPLWMWYRELLHTSGRWLIVYTRYGLQRYVNVLTTLTQQGC